MAALERQLGGAGEWTSDDAGARALVEPLISVPALRTILADYRERVLTARELPAIVRAFEHARRNEVRELLDLDREFSDAPVPVEFKRASQAVGRRRLHKLRPMRDHRLVQRYIVAVDEGRSHAWHPIVFGLFLAVYSLPLRQGLLHYAERTLGAFVHAAAPRLGLRNGELDALSREAVEGLGTVVEAALPHSDFSALRSR